MKALRWTDVKTMQWEEIGAPETPAGWVGIDSLMAGICGSELGAFLGHNELRTPPLVMGHEFSGHLAQDVPEQGLRRGDLVTVNPLVSCGRCRACLSGNRQRCAQRRIIGIDYSGAFGARVAVPPQQCYRIEDPVHGTLVEPLACALRAIHQADLAIGDAVVVIGAGIIGLLCTAVANASGGQVIVVEPNSARLKDAEAWGATTVMGNTDTVVQELRARMPEGVDRVIDAVGYSATRHMSLELVRRGGRSVWIGLHEGSSTIPGNQVVRDETEVLGSFCYRDEEFHRAVDLVNAGFTQRSGSWLDVRPAAMGQQAFEEQASGPAPFAKIVLQVS